MDRSVKLAAITRPEIDGVNSAEEFIAYCARVSNPTNQMNTETAGRLLKYCIDNDHWSIFETVSLTLEIKCTRDIGRQILRHRSFTFQEFSQRYAAVDIDNMFSFRECRLQDKNNRQSSTPTSDKQLEDWFVLNQARVQKVCGEFYQASLDKGIAKEQARCSLPEGMTMSHMYMTGTLRSWIHYCMLRTGNGTQREHSYIARDAWDIVSDEFPSIGHIVQYEPFLD